MSSQLYAEKQQTPIALPKELKQKLDKYSKRLGEKLIIGLKTIDEKGKVPLKTLLRTMMSRGFAKVGSGPVPQYAIDGDYAEKYYENRAKEDKFVASRFKADAEGMFGQQELVNLFKNAILEFGIGRNASLDTNKDFKLTLKEFATGIPIRKGETTDAEGYTEKQKKIFQSQDLDKDGFISSLEWLGPELMHSIDEHAEELLIVMYAGKMDKNSDGKISKSELMVFLPEHSKKLPESFPMSEFIHNIRLLDHEIIHELAAAIAKS